MKSLEVPPGALHVAVGVVRNARGEVLIARRHAHLHQGGLWEFPGGKREPGESAEEALRRELEEELGIVTIHSVPLIQVHHAYKDRVVFLDTMEVLEYSGTPEGRESQPIAWVPADQLCRFSFPAANRPLVAAARLPDRYGILDLSDASDELMKRELLRLHAGGLRLVQLRAKTLGSADYRGLAERAIKQSRSLGLTLMLNAAPELAQELGANVHLSADRLKTLESRPLADGFWVAASCHNLDELRRSEGLGADFAVLGPVLQTPTHPCAKPLGWSVFRSLVRAVNIPVYALGGMNLDCLALARQNGGRGIAGIRGITG